MSRKRLLQALAATSLLAAVGGGTILVAGAQSSPAGQVPAVVAFLDAGW